MSHKSIIPGIRKTLQESINISDWVSNDISGSHTDSVRNHESIKYITALRDDFLSILSDVSNPEDHEFCITLFFIRLKSEWTLINTRYTYQIQSDTLDQSLLFRAGLLSALMGKVESYLSQDVASHLNNVLTDPTGTASEKEQALQQYNALVDAQTSLEGLRARTEKAERARQVVQSQLDDLARSCGVLDGGTLLLELRRQQERIELLTQERDRARETEVRLKSLLGVSSTEDIEVELNRLRESAAFLTAELLARPAVAPPISPSAEPAPEPQDLESMLMGLEKALKSINA